MVEGNRRRSSLDDFVEGCAAADGTGIDANPHPEKEPPRQHSGGA
jgi:hypothetical protein